MESIPSSADLQICDIFNSPITKRSQGEVPGQDAAKISYFNRETPDVVDKVLFEFACGRCKIGGQSFSSLINLMNK